MGITCVLWSILSVVAKPKRPLKMKMKAYKINKTISKHNYINVYSPFQYSDSKRCVFKSCIQIFQQSITYLVSSLYSSK